MADSFLAFILDQLRDVGDVRGRAMFGGFGIYCRDEFFGIVYDDRLYFRTDDNSASEYVARGMSSFRPNERQTLRNYYEVPTEILDVREQLTAWGLVALRRSS